MILFNCKKTLIVTLGAVSYNPPLQSQPNLGSESLLWRMVLLHKLSNILVFIVQYFHCITLFCVHFIFIVIFVTKVFEIPTGGYFQTSYYCFSPIDALRVFRIETTWEYVNQFVFTTFCLCFSFTGINFRVTLHHVCDVAYDENWCGPIRTRKYRSAN